MKFYGEYPSYYSAYWMWKSHFYLLQYLSGANDLRSACKDIRINHNSFPYDAVGNNYTRLHVWNSDIVHKYHLIANFQQMYL